jgi:hypothetical protein
VDAAVPADLDPFALFCAYHLGLNTRGQRRFQNLHDVARDFGVGVDVVEAALVRHRLDAARLLHVDFDLGAARFDIEASPPGVDLLALAWMHWELLQAAPDKPRDWAAEADDDARANEAVFGKPRR